MSMTPAELREHTDRLRSLLQDKLARMPKEADHPRVSASLSVQILALLGRVDELEYQLDLLDKDAVNRITEIQVPRPGPGFVPAPRVVT
jgi:hypothetical protein